MNPFLNKHKNVQGYNWIKKETNFVLNFKKSPFVTINVFNSNIIKDEISFQQLTNDFKNFKISNNNNNNINNKTRKDDQELFPMWLMSDWKIQGIKF